MKITVIGTGYVGIVSGSCLADVGNDVLCFDVDAEKIRILKEGGIQMFRKKRGHGFLAYGRCLK